MRSLTDLNTRGIKVAYFYPALVLIILSFSLQFTFTVCVLMIRRSKNKDEHDGNDPDLVLNRRRRRLSENNIDTVCFILQMAIVIVNIGIACVGIEPERGGENMVKVVGDVHNCTQMVATTVQP
ncbi:uncharacterized protein LOC127853227 [Dreissena polymorpha]|nr:uncharacterized protein LOC127853227 [Dreissena polymorpha]